MVIPARCPRIWTIKATSKGRVGLGCRGYRLQALWIGPAPHFPVPAPACYLLLDPHPPPPPHPPSVWLRTLNWELHLQTGSSCNLLAGCAHLCLGHRKLRAETCTVGWSSLWECSRFVRHSCVACTLPRLSGCGCPRAAFPVLHQSGSVVFHALQGQGYSPGASFGVKTYFICVEERGRDRASGSPGWPPTPGFTGTCAAPRPAKGGRP